MKRKSSFPILIAAIVTATLFGCASLQADDETKVPKPAAAVTPPLAPVAEPLEPVAEPLEPAPTDDIMPAMPAAPGTVPPSLMESLGEERYRIGEIIVDKAAGEFTVPGKVANLTAPLEYFAVARNGIKGYESLLELSTSERDFNVACILIGLDETGSVKPRYQFDDRKVEGQRVEISLTWKRGDDTMRVSAANAMLAGDKMYDDDNWVYIGPAMADENQPVMAESMGSLIGFVHDPFSIIDHHSGAGIGAYGIMTANTELLPPEGASVNLVVSLIKD